MAQERDVELDVAVAKLETRFDGLDTRLEAIDGHLRFIDQKLVGEELFKETVKRLEGSINTPYIKTQCQAEFVHNSDNHDKIFIRISKLEVSLAQISSKMAIVGSISAIFASAVFNYLIRKF